MMPSQQWFSASKRKIAIIFPKKSYDYDKKHTADSMCKYVWHFSGQQTFKKQIIKGNIEKLVLISGFKMMPGYPIATSQEAITCLNLINKTIDKWTTCSQLTMKAWEQSQMTSF